MGINKKRRPNTEVVEYERCFQLPKDKGLLNGIILDTISDPDLSSQISELGNKYNVISNG